ncbi:hypothetical protein FQR65_LT08264 [Abscondita terminalis]|nr:hypothetical protein FQR65_LT08264 [Abscondita terminalis]
MYAFRRYNPDLSRRTCRVGVYVLVILFVVEYATANTQNHASVVDTFENVETLSGQQINSVPRVKRAENSESTIASSGDGTTAATATTSESTASSTDKMEEKPPQRFEFASVNFHRVEIPFIIALWIFCASLAKIDTPFHCHCKPRRPVLAGARCCRRLPPWQSNREFSSYVMYAFRRYNPDLSRRTCRVGVYVLVILFVVEYATANTQNHASVVDTFENVETLSGQQINSVPRVKRAENSESTIASSGDGTTAATATTSESTASSTDKMEEKPPQRFEFASVNFHRVEIPFIIALWIFCASLAKIGSFQF